MSQLLSGLNPEQKIAVLHDHSTNGALLILAGAGSGKTSVLTKRILYRIEQGLPSPKILALTFTAKAAAEMSERVKQFAPNSQALLCTFHSLALRILRAKINGIENWKRVGFANSPIPKETADFEWQNALVENGFKAGSLNRDELFSNEPQNKKYESRIKNLQKEVLQSGHIIFDDLIHLATRLITNFSEVNLYVKNSWTEILIDEYQDINPAQYKFARAILGESKNIFAVGDDDQAIYGFRGADIRNILRFQNDFPNCRIIKLEWNYRSTARILETANRIFTDKSLTFRKSLRPAASRNYPLFRENLKPEIWHSQSAEEEIAKIAHEIKFLKNEYNLQNSDFALLSRYNRQCEYYKLALKEFEIPTEGENSIHIETIHASKGLQYAVVFYCGLAETLSPAELPNNRKERKKQLAEEKRLFYVGVTRAESHLIFLYCSQRFFKGELTIFKKSRFLKFAAEKPLKKGIKMPVSFFKFLAIVQIIGYMFLNIPLFVFHRIFRANTADAWLQNKLLSWAKFCLRVLKIELNVKGQEKLSLVNWFNPVIVIANHNSFADIPAVLVCVQRHLGFLAKKELSLIPVLSYWMRKIGCVFIDRKNKNAGQKLRSSLSNSRNQIPQIIIFPEGTRSKNGESGVWKSGAFRMAAEFKATIIPVRLKGTAQTWEKLKTSNKIHEVDAEILDPFYFNEDTNYKDAMNKIKSTY
ncbi:hypothetical protein AGMMS49938_07870 [Fibrobacterales bacterium]|nr:hypothetical protein AGMMS49938_07870 [Fibrobacterales bacterium]